MSYRLLLAALAISVAAPARTALAGEPSPARSPAPKAIAGAWKLDPARSEDARKKMHEDARRGGRRSGRAGRAWWRTRRPGTHGPAGDARSGGRPAGGPRGHGDHRGCGRGRARWDGETLVNEIWLGDDTMHVTEMLERDGATGELRFTVRVENSRFGGDPLTVTRVYVPEGPTSPATPPSKTTGTAEGLKIRMGSTSVS